MWRAIGMWLLREIIKDVVEEIAQRKQKSHEAD